RRSWSSSASPNSGPCFSQPAVEPSMSVNIRATHPCGGAMACVSIIRRFARRVEPPSLARGGFRLPPDRAVEKEGGLPFRRMLYEVVAHPARDLGARRLTGCWYCGETAFALAQHPAPLRTPDHAHL